MDAPEKVIEMINNLPVINYNAAHQITQKPIERCPTGAIVWRDQQLGALKA